MKQEDAEILTKKAYDDVIEVLKKYPEIQFSISLGFNCEGENGMKEVGIQILNAAKGTDKFMAFSIRQTLDKFKSPVILRYLARRSEYLRNNFEDILELMISSGVIDGEIIDMPRDEIEEILTIEKKKTTPNSGLC